MSRIDDLTPSADKTAIGLSFLCVLHCLLLPVVVALLPAAGILSFDDEWFHRILLLFVLPVSAFALFIGVRRHRNMSVMAIGITGLLILVVGAAIGHDVFGETGERIVTLIGSVLVAISHLRNFRLCQIRPAH